MSPKIRKRITGDNKVNEEKIRSTASSRFSFLPSFGRALLPRRRDLTEHNKLQRKDPERGLVSVQCSAPRSAEHCSAASIFARLRLKKLPAQRARLRNTSLRSSRGNEAQISFFCHGSCRKEWPSRRALLCSINLWTLFQTVHWQVLRLTFCLNERSGRRGSSALPLERSCEAAAGGAVLAWLW